jgi:hypothetical protein
LQTDVIEYARQQGLFRGSIARSPISPLYNEERTAGAGRRQNRRDLRDRRSMSMCRAPEADHGAPPLSARDPATLTNDDQGAAIEIAQGRIAVIARRGKPAPLFQGLDGRTTPHLLSIPPQPGGHRRLSSDPADRGIPARGA